MIKRQIEDSIRATVSAGKAVVLLGPRQVGKSTLVNLIFSGDSSVKWFTGDDPADRDALTGISLARLKLILGDSQGIVRQLSV